jgi:hypothetical protein
MHSFIYYKYEYEYEFLSLSKYKLEKWSVNGKPNFMVIGPACRG